MANLILGPQLRRVTPEQAVIWLQTDSPARVTVRAGEASATVDTFTTHGVHVALPVIASPRVTTPYTVELDGEPVWPLPGLPPSVITVRDDGDATIVFGSCREAKRHPDPDALVAYAARAMQTAMAQTARLAQEETTPAAADPPTAGGRAETPAATGHAAGHGEEPLPDLLALIGDQIYADEVWTFDEYVELYRAAWSEPHVRWLLSTVSTVMIFDDHEIHDDWNSSAAWLAEMSARPGWEEHLRAGLESYWLFQHLGNDPTAEKLPDDWSFTVDIGRTRLIMLDCRGSRLLEERRMFPQAQWDRLREQSQADCDHLVLAASLPWLLPPAIHHAEAAMEVLSRRYPKMELLRRKYDLEHWSAVGHSFDELAEVVEAVTGPATVSVIGGDVHHSYLARVLPGRHQITCSPLNNSVDAKMRTMLKIGWWRTFSGPAALVARLVGVPRDGVRWRLMTKPYFGNAIATLTHRGRTARVVIEGTRSDGTLYPVASADLT